MKTGVYYGIPFEEYCAIPALNKSSLDHFEISALHFKHRDVSNKETPAKRLGSGIHCAILEPERFATEYRAAPVPEDFPQALVSADDYKEACKKLELPVTGTKEVLKKRINEAQASLPFQVKFFDDIEAEFARYKLLSPKDYETAKRIAENVQNSAAAQTIMGEGDAEVTIVWVDPETGILCKGRVDWLLKDFSIILDWKSTSKPGGASPREFRKSIANFNYHRQPPWYIDGVKAVTGIEPTFIFGAYETDAPYASAFYCPSLLMLDQGRRENRFFVEKYVHCVKNDEWQGYSDLIEPIDLPPWKNLDRELESAV